MGDLHRDGSQGRLFEGWQADGYYHRRSLERARMDSYTECRTVHFRQQVGSPVLTSHRVLNKQIAANLGIVEKTLKVQWAKVFTKLGVHSIAELVRLCVLAGGGT